MFKELKETVSKSLKVDWKTLKKTWLNRRYSMFMDQKISFFLMFIYLFWERQSVNREGAEREGDRIPSRLHTQHGAQCGLKPTNREIMTWFEIKSHTLRDAWAAQSVKWPTSAQVMISQLVSSSPASGSVLTVQSLEPALDSVSLSLPLPQLTLCLSLSKINILKKCFL